MNGDTPNTDWMGELDYDKKGNAKASPKTLKVIMLNDPCFKMVRFDLFSQRDTITDASCPFVGTHAPDEVDDTSLSRMCSYLSEMYGIELSINSLIDRMLRPTAPERAYHAVKEFIMREKWDGKPRVDTLLIDYLGADDTPLTRAGPWDVLPTPTLMTERASSSTTASCCTVNRAPARARLPKRWQAGGEGRYPSPTPRRNSTGP